MMKSIKIMATESFFTIAQLIGGYCYGNISLLLPICKKALAISGMHPFSSIRKGGVHFSLARGISALLQDLKINLASGTHSPPHQMDRAIGKGILLQCYLLKNIDFISFSIIDETLLAKVNTY